MHKPQICGYAADATKKSMHAFDKLLKSHTDSPHLAVTLQNDCGYDSDSACIYSFLSSFSITCLPLQLLRMHCPMPDLFIFLPPLAEWSDCLNKLSLTKLFSAGSMSQKVLTTS